MQPGALFVLILAVMTNISVCGSSPSKPRNVTATVIQPYNVMVTWNEPLNDDNSSLTYTVFYKAKGKGWDEKTVVKDTQAILSTKPYRTYKIFVMVEANGLYSVPSARVYNVTTPQAVPESCPTIADISERQPNQIGVTWNQIPEDDQNGPNFGYIIYYKNCSMDKLLNSTINGADHDYMDIKNLGPGPYGLKVVAYNSVGLCTKNPEPLVSEERYKQKKYMTCKAIPSVLPSLSTSVKIGGSSTTQGNTPLQTYPTPTVVRKTTLTQGNTPQPTSTTTTHLVVTPSLTQKTTPQPTTDKQEVTRQPCVCPTQEPSASNTEKPAGAVTPSLTQGNTPSLAVRTTTLTQGNRPQPTSTTATRPAVTQETTPQPTTDKQEVTRQPCTSPNTQEPSESNTERPAEKLANSKDYKWLMYVAIALAVIVVVMGVAIFLLIWQLCKNHRFYQLQVREQQYRMPRKDGGHDNRAQETPYVENEC